MRIHVDLASLLANTPRIVQVDKTPQPTTPPTLTPGVPLPAEPSYTPMNGKFVIETPPSIDFPVTGSSYVLNGGGNVDGGDVTSIAFANLLDTYQMFDHIYYNPLLTPGHVGELDPTATFKDRNFVPPQLYPSRFQSGRASGGILGQMPTHTAIPPVNIGCAINEIDVENNGLITNGDTFLINGIPFVAGGGAGQWAIGGSASATATNIAAAVTGNASLVGLVSVNVLGTPRVMFTAVGGTVVINITVQTHTGCFVRLGPGTITPQHPGVLITDNIDLSPYITTSDGFDSFSVYWRLSGFAVSSDVASDYGAFAGVNQAVTRLLYEVDQQPSGLAVYLSPDNGDHWCPVNLLQPLGLNEPTTTIRLAFLNWGTSRIYLSHYAAMF